MLAEHVVHDLIQRHVFDLVQVRNGSPMDIPVVA